MEDDEWQQKVLGVALVVEEIGKVSKLVFRYPSSSPSQQHGGQEQQQQQQHQQQKQQHQQQQQQRQQHQQQTSSGGDGLKENIFFTLSPQVMSKLFRTKPALCEQPMTLLIDSTILCCRSVLLNQTQSNVSSNDDSNGKTSTHLDDGLVLFSIIVAVLPVMEGPQIQGVQFGHPYESTDGIEEGEMHCKHDGGFVSLSFPTVRRIHLSLARLCAVLAREERRCMYMSRQVSMLLNIGNINIIPRSSTSNDNEVDPFSEAEMVEMMIAANPPLPEERKEDTDDMEGDENEEQFMRRNLRSRIPLKGNLAMELSQFYHACARNDAACSRVSPASLLSGREGIIYINHHIAINVEPASERKSMLNDVHFHNQIISTSGNEIIPLLRPYHTILFPHVSAAELLQNTRTTSLSSQLDINKTGDLSQRRLEKLLTVCDPFKSLSDMALETALPLSAITEAAMSLMESGACIAAPVIQKSTIFACCDDAMERMAKLKLEFAQQFSHTIPIFVVVSALTTTHSPSTFASTQSASKASEESSSEERALLERAPSHVTFGDVIRYCRFCSQQAMRLHAADVMSNGDPDVMVVDDQRENVPRVFHVLTNTILSTLDRVATEEDVVGTSSGHEQQETHLIQSVESVLIAMTVWLRSHSIIVELKDYFVSISSFLEQSDEDKLVAQVVAEEYEGNSKQNLPMRLNNERKSPNDLHNSPFVHEDIADLLKKCLELGYLCGSISSTAFQWKLGISPRRLEALQNYGLRENKIHVVTRIPCVTDDWGAS